MKKIIVTIPYSVQITEDRWEKRHVSRQFDESKTVGDVLAFVNEVNSADISSSIITLLEEKQSSMKRKKAYISGPISGLPFEKVEQAFNDAEIRLQEEGYEVVNPLENGLTKDHSWKEHMKADIKLLMECDTIYMLKGWTGSKGARIEYQIAVLLEYDIIEQIK